MSKKTEAASQVEAQQDREVLAQNLTINATIDITKKEHDLGVLAAIRLHPMAVFWSAFFCIAVIMSGFDPQLITSFYALPAFQKHYGSLYNGEYGIPARWQLALGMGNPVGQVVGGLASGWPLEKLGRKLTLAICCCWSIAWVFLQFFSRDLGALCAGEFLAGLGYGFYVVIAPVYASEVCPLALRGMLTASVNLAFVIGQFIAQGCAAGVETKSGVWAYKIPFAVQWIWPVVLLSGLYFAPESPYWLVRQDRREEARRALEHLTVPENHHNIDGVLTMIEETNTLEQEFEHSTSYWDCFRGSNLRRTEICVMVYLIQVIGGNPLIGYANYFFETAGLPDKSAFDMGVINTALGFVGTCCSWLLMVKFGRRTIYNGGMVFMTIVLLVIGFLSINQSSKPIIWAQASLMDIWTFCYQMTVGPICFVLISEISSTRLRGRTIAIATAVQAVASIIFTVAIPYMLAPNEANWKGRAGYLFGGISAICLAWCYFRLPESRKRTFEEIDILFEKKVSARKFSTYNLIEEAEVAQGKAENVNYKLVE